MAGAESHNGQIWLQALAALTRDLSDRYDITVEGVDPNRKPRYVAIARSLEVHPYAVVTSDPAEMRVALRARLTGTRF